MKKRIYSLLLAGLICSILYGCGKKNETKNEPVNVTEATTQAEENVEENEEMDFGVTADELGIEVADPEKEDVEGTIVVLVDDMDLVHSKYAEYKRSFEKKYPEAKVVFRVYTQYDKEVTKRLEEGDYGDVLLIPESVDLDHLSDYFDPLGTMGDLSEKYNPNYLERYEEKGVIYGIPRYVMPQGIAYNRRVFERLRVTKLPQTPEAFLELLQGIKEKDETVIPFYVNENQTENLATWQQYVWGSVAGSLDYHYEEMLKDDSPFAKDKPNYIVYKLLYDIVANGLSGGDTASLQEASAMLNRGEIACMAADWNMLETLREADTNPDDIGYMPFPYTIGNDQYATARIDTGYAINKNSSNKATARAFIDYMLDTSKFAESQGAVSMKKDAELPNSLADFENVFLVVDRLPKGEAAATYRAHSELYERLIHAGTEKARIVSLARGEASEPEEGEGTPATEEESFDALMEVWNTRWREER